MSGPSGPRWAFRLLLRLFPAAFREARGAAMERLFLDTHREWVRRYGRAGFRFWAAVVWDTSTQALVERVARVPGPADLVSSGLQDVRFALRKLARRPVPGLLIIALMAVGIAGNTAVFRVVNGLFLRPLPFPAAERLVDLDETAPAWDLEYVSVAYADFLAWREGNRTFEAMAVYDRGDANLAGGDGAERVSVLAGTHDLDDVLGLEPLLGRFFTAEENVPGGPSVVLVSEGFWSRHFGRDPEVVGRTAELDGIDFEIVGVLPPEARFLGDAEFWTPLGRDAEDSSGYSFSGLGRLEPGVTLEQARADLEAVHRGLTETRHMNGITSPVVSSLRDRYLGDLRTGSGFLLGAVVVVLLIACANIAGLVVARGLARESEMAVRRALGAGQGRIVRQLLTESVVLALLGAAVGTALGLWGSSVAVGGLTDRFPSFVTFDVDGRVLGFTVAATAGAVLLFGLLPALQTAGAGAMRGNGRSTGSRRRRRSMRVLVAGEVALALALLVVGGLSVLDVARLGGVDPGFEPDNVLTWELALPDVLYPDGAARRAFVDEYLARLRALPGVEDAAVASSLPTTGHWGWFFEVVGAPQHAEGEGDPVVLNRAVTPGYERTMDVELVRGRFLDESDGGDAGSRAVVVNETFVRTFFGEGVDPVGARVAANGDEPMTVVGVTRDVRHYGADEEMRPGVYQPFRQLPVANIMVAVRTTGDPAAVAPPVRRVRREVDPALALFDVRTMEQRMDGALWTRRAVSWLIGGFSAVALLLAVAGLFGVVSYTVGRRTREISIRLALGARAGQVRRQVVGEGMALVGVGVVLGLAGAFGAAGLLSGVLVGVDPRDPLVYGVVTVLVVVVAAAANDLPARKAARLDPMRSLRGE